MKKLNYNHTVTVSYISLTVQALAINFMPLLFVILSSTYGISLDKIGLLVTVNFLFQLFIDFVSAKFLDKIGYKIAMIGAQITASLGLILLGFLPDIMDPFSALLIATLCLGLGSGLIEVTVSPVVEAIPEDQKNKGAISVLHSFYCWGQLLTVLLSTLFFVLFGIKNWRILSFLWACVPLLNGIYCVFVPVRSLNEKAKPLPIKTLLKNKLFWLFIFIMICAGATELTVSQWASALAEKSLNVTKTVGDLLGPCFFALLMGIVRAVFGRFADKIKVENALLLSGFIGVIGYLMISLSPVPFISLSGCALTGIASALLWPGTLTLSAKSIYGGGTAMFALLALGGDLGCSLGPGIAGYFSEIFGQNLQIGVLFGIIFPVGIIIGSLIYKINK